MRIRSARFFTTSPCAAVQSGSGGGGVIQHLRSGRLAWPLVALLAAGSVPGSIGGAWIRVHHLRDTANFEFFAAGVLILLGLQLFWFSFRPGEGRIPPAGAVVCRLTARLGTIVFTDRVHVFSPVAVVSVGLVAGLLGGAYGIGGGVITAPLLVALLRLPVHAVAGATLPATLPASLTAVLSYQSHSLVATGVGPDWALGSVMGVGGLIGIWLGSRLQGRISPRVIQWILSGCAAVVAGRYLASG